MDPRVEANLRGQVIHKPKEQIWMLKMDSVSSFGGDTLEPDDHRS